MGSGAKRGSSGRRVEMSRSDYEKRIAVELARIQGEIGILVKALDFLRKEAASQKITPPRPILLVGPGCMGLKRVVKPKLPQGAQPRIAKVNPLR